MRFHDRVDAGFRLARLLENHMGEDAVILGLPRGGAVVGHVVARHLHLPFDVLIVRKMGAPSQHELAIGAVGEEGVTVLNDSVIETLGLSGGEVKEIEDATREELDRRVDLYRYSNQRRDLHLKTAIIVDDGIATGATATAACRIARAAGARKVVLAVPVAPSDARRRFGEVCDEVVALQTPDWIDSVGQVYERFEPTSDSDVLRLLDDSRIHEDHAEVDVPIDATTVVRAVLTVPLGSKAIVVFVHGSGSSRHSPRNKAVARGLQVAGYATMQCDLLTPWEEQDRKNVFDIDLLRQRLEHVSRWLGDHVSTRDLPLVLFGSSTGAAAALALAGVPACNVMAVVSRGGRVDLVGDRLSHVSCPVLMLVGSRDTDVLTLNRQASALMRCPHSISVVQSAGHLFEEPGALDTVTHRAIEFLDDAVDGFARQQETIPAAFKR